MRILKHPDDALDCCQEVFLEAVRRSRRGPVDDWGAFLRWLAARRAVDHLRRRRSRSFVRLHDPGIPEPPACEAPAVDACAQFEELVEQVRQQLGSLPEPQAVAFWLVCVEERSYEEVAGQMNVTRNALGVLVHRARRHMRTALKSLNPAHTD